MNANTTTERDDLFTIIHKGLRLGLFDITVRRGVPTGPIRLR
jgi:hypothetical protein